MSKKLFTVAVIIVAALLILVAGGAGLGYWLMTSTGGGGTSLANATLLESGEVVIFTNNFADQTLEVSRVTLSGGAPRALWTTPVRGMTLGSRGLVESPGLLAFALQQPNRVILLDRQTGAPRAQIPIRGSFNEIVRLTDEAVLIDDDLTRSIAPDGVERWTLPHSGNCVHDYYLEGALAVINGCRGALVDLGSGRVLRALDFERNTAGVWPMATLPGTPPRLLLRAGASFGLQPLAEAATFEPLVTSPLGEGTPITETRLVGTRDGASLFLSETGGGHITMTNGSSTDDPDPLWAYAIDLEARQVRWSTRLGSWRVPGTFQRVFGHPEELPAQVATLGRRDIESNPTYQLALLEAATGQVTWATPTFRTEGNIWLHNLAGGPLIVVRSLEPYQLVLARFDGATGRLSAAVAVEGGQNLNGASIAGDRVIVSTSDHWFLLSLDSLEVVASSASAEERARLLRPGADRARALLQLPEEALR